MENSIRLESFTKDYYGASFAHEKAQRNLENNTKKNISELFNKYINRAIDCGKFRVSVPDSLINENTSQFLENLGYNIKRINSGPNEISYEIVW